MPITALPESTICTLSSTQSLIDPTSVIKELIDNSLDAGATSITVEVSQNLLDIIQAKDNGCGIAPPDRQLIARRHCTSKISNENDLTTLGGRALGFRGEALANAAEMSRKLTVTTRIEGELVGTALTFGNDGSVCNAQPKSHAVGTTTRIEEFLYAHPVRKQLVANQRQRMLSRIHDICKAYAAARSGMRISFSVLKTSKQHENCVFASRASDTLDDIATRLAGQAVSAHCMSLEVQLNGLKVSAILPKPESDLSCDKFVSIDGRPLRSNSGVSALLLKTMKQHTGWSKYVGSASRIGFLILRITCSSITYDVNIEPAKDDVQFEDIASLVATFSLLLDQAYPHGGNALQEKAVDEITNIPNDRENTTTVQPSQTTKSSTSIGEPADRSAQLDSSNDAVRGRDAKRAEIQAFNPWTAAKINTSLSSNKGRPRMSLLRSDESNRDDTLVTGLITPETSPMRKNPTRFPEITTHISRPKILEVPEPSPALPSPVKSVHSPQKRLRPEPPAWPNDSRSVDRLPLAATQQEPQDVSIVAQPSALRHLALPPTLMKSKKSQHESANKPFKLQRPKGKDPEKDAWFDIPQMRRDEQIRNRVRLSQQASQATMPWSPAHEGSNTRALHESIGNTADIRMFMERKDARNEPVKKGILLAETPSQHQGQDEPGDQRASLESSPIAHDREPLVELDKNQPSRVPTRAKSDRSRRTKSSMLPLERSPADFHVQNLSLALPSVSMDEIRRLRTGDIGAADSAQRADSPGLCGVFAEEELNVLVEKVKNLVQVSKGHKFPLGRAFEDQVMAALKSQAEEVEEEMLMC